jgi:hypothetical protein
MSTAEWIAWISLGLQLAFLVGVFAARNALKAYIERGVQHHFETKLEELRAELRKNEERFKSDLRDKEAEISTLRNSVLSGSANRQSLLDKRQFEAVERVWANVNDLAPYKMVAAMMAKLDMKKIATQFSDQDLRKFVDVVEKVAPNIKELKNAARDEQPFVTDLAWAYFSAYRTIVMNNLLILQVLKLGMRDLDKLFEGQTIQKLLKAAVPHHSEFIEKYERQPEAYYYLLEEVEASLFAELRRMLEGKEADHAAIAKAKEIMIAVKAANVEQAQQAANVG